MILVRLGLVVGRLHERPIPVYVSGWNSVG
jgi:hypothetical protein